MHCPKHKNWKMEARKARRRENTAFRNGGDVSSDVMLGRVAKRGWRQGTVFNPVDSGIDLEVEGDRYDDYRKVVDEFRRMEDAEMNSCDAIRVIDGVQLEFDEDLKG